MKKLSAIRNEIHKKQKQEGTNMSDESLVVAMHLEFNFRVPWSNAYPQVSQGKDDHGIDGWYYHKEEKKLYIFQSKLTDNKTLVLKGLDDLTRAADWLTECLINRKTSEVTTNNVLTTLVEASEYFHNEVREIYFSLLSPFEDEEELNKLVGDADFNKFRRTLEKHPLNKKFGIEFVAETYVLRSKKIAHAPVKYPIKQFSNSNLNYKSGSLKISYLPLEQLVHLYKTHGPELFHKNIRLTVWDLTKKSPKKVAHPVLETLESIVEGKESPAVFTFYHSGVTIFAETVDFVEDNICLENPSIINGCQTTTIATKFYDDLRKSKDKQLEKKLKLFSEIKVIAKVIIGVDSDDLREITNNNNRQNHIESWQLFSNHPIHIEIESLLKERKIFYGRQAGLYNEKMKDIEVLSYFSSNSKAELKVKELAQVQAIYKQEYSFSAKPDTIFDSKESHSKIFNENFLQEIDKIVFRVNVNKAIKSMTKNFIDQLSIESSSRGEYKEIFGGKGNQRFVYSMHHVLIKLAEQKIKGELRDKIDNVLFKNPSKDLIGEFTPSFNKVIRYSKKWYEERQHSHEGEMPKSALDQFVIDASNYLIKVR